MKLILLKNRDMVINKARLNIFLCEAKLHYFKYYIEPNLKRKQIDLWERKHIITNIKNYTNLLKQLYYNKDGMTVEEYLKEIGWDGYIDIFENDYDERSFRKIFVKIEKIRYLPIDEEWRLYEKTKKSN